MSAPLREELERLAETQTFSPDPSAWDRGRRARRRSRVAAGVAVVALVAGVGGLGALAVRPDTIAPADVVPDGAIPSRIERPTGRPLTDLAIGRASVAYVDEGGQPVLVDATTGEATRVELPDFPTPEVLDLTTDYRRGSWLALSPDGRRVAYPTVSRMDRDTGSPSFITSWYRVVDLGTGDTDLVELPPGAATPLAMSWTSDGRIAVDGFGRPSSVDSPPDIVGWTVDPATGDSGTAPLTGVIAPGRGISAQYPSDDAAVRAVPFETTTGTDPGRELPGDLYPDGARVMPLGWADNSLLVAEVDAPAGSYVEGRHLVLLTSPDRPKVEWTYRIMVRDVPETESLSVAVDLVPDLDGTSSQQLTHDFTRPGGDPRPERAPYLLGGLVALLAGLAFIRMMRHRA